MAAVILFGSQMPVGIILITDGQASMIGLLAVPSLLGAGMITCIAVTGRFLQELRTFPVKRPTISNVRVEKDARQSCVQARTCTFLAA